MRLAAQLAPIDDLEAWQKHIYYKKLTIAGARFARNSIMLRRPSSSLAKYMIVRSAARAVFRQDARLAERLQASHYLARNHLQIDFVNNTVTLSVPELFTELSNHLHSEVARKQQAQLQDAAQAHGNPQVQQKLRERAKRPQKVSELWSPLDRRHLLQ
eukprot:3585326-Pyramimonas_sp.AAC.1